MEKKIVLLVCLSLVAPSLCLPPSLPTPVPTEEGSWSDYFLSGLSGLLSLFNSAEALSIEILEIDEVTASLSCSLSGSSSPNLTWWIGQNPASPSTVKKAEGVSTVFLNWEDLGLEEGDTITVTCETKNEEELNGTGVFILESVSDILVVPGEDSEVYDDYGINDSEDEIIPQEDEEDDDEELDLNVSLTEDIEGVDDDDEAELTGDDIEDDEEENIDEDGSDEDLEDEDE